MGNGRVDAFDSGVGLGNEDLRVGLGFCTAGGLLNNGILAWAKCIVLFGYTDARFRHWQIKETRQL